MKSIHEYQIDAALSDKRTATYWVEHYEAMPRWTDGQRVALNAYRREADVVGRHGYKFWSLPVDHATVIGDSYQRELRAFFDDEVDLVACTLAQAVAVLRICDQARELAAAAGR